MYPLGAPDVAASLTYPRCGPQSRPLLLGPDPTPFHPQRIAFHLGTHAPWEDRRHIPFKRRVPDAVQTWPEPGPCPALAPAEPAPPQAALAPFKVSLSGSPQPHPKLFNGIRMGKAKPAFLWLGCGGRGERSLLMLLTSLVLIQGWGPSGPHCLPCVAAAGLLHGELALLVPG